MILKKDKKVHAFLKQSSVLLNKNTVFGLPRKTQGSFFFFLKQGLCFSRNDCNRKFIMKSNFNFQSQGLRPDKSVENLFATTLSGRRPDSAQTRLA
ncbi:MAG: hypothetical protein A3G71_04940 [Gammaproteobacteria bacterium RIFCSPLOWO2_12_FULL_38_14]|nr:MAG: hypothetical protein A3B69_02060 [Gammaproteobacteria bacterium RIFCSPHIGHO2_02_FULL_38_33]OGT77978.1 MAG: hypothetical protein A3G71_04940 [Gammaproteobacteria bacterium RIFCSPLOWO2_12_FULL_38_14]